MSLNIGSKVVHVLLLALAVCALQGCAGSRPQADEAPVFFPPLPNAPRLQYLTHIENSKEFAGQKDKFSLFVYGATEEEKVRRIHKPFGIKTHNGKIYVSDLGASNIVIIDPAEMTFSDLKGNYSLGKLMKPASLAIDEEGRIYVADTMRKDIVVYNAEGDYLTAYGKELGIKPVDVEVDDKFIYVLDLPSNEIKVLDRKTGKYLRSIGKADGKGEGIALATAMTLGPDGLLYVSNAGSGRVLKYDRDGHLLDAFGEMGDSFGMFARPKGLDVDELGQIYVVDGGHQNVQIFSAEQRLLLFFGDPGLNPEFRRGVLNLPTDIAVTRDNLEFFKRYADPAFEVEKLLFVINQYGPHKVAVYGLGQLRDGGIAGN
jgi:sugar lactone lactonase YvrE